MLRVISGLYKSRKLKEVKNDKTRPTTDKNKEIIFNTLGQYFDGGTVLDLFAGSGALGIEALSRGFDSCDFVENNFAATKIITENIKTLKIEDYTKVHKQDVFSYLQTTNQTYDLIIADPPYSLTSYIEILDIISARQLLNESGIIVLESEKTKELPDKSNDLTKYKEKISGITKFTLYQRRSGQ
jgi:16S rRNA (guanine966-N2)-methyltransferase